ncbi:MAG TPA: TRAP transporter fused permease subunit [Porticoccaceae bacterium]|jgi:TRAP transporter 4TM/12TM fusion protein|nr:TRAP transporter fused permease subunit [Gammaproteobacteria bacterium]HIL60684.1 TRAP transporter fused permease subunit [Porticoccaceae bacterium]
MNSVYLRWAAFLFALFHIYCNVFASISELWLSAIHFGGFCAICAFMANESENVARYSLSYWINITLAVTAIFTSTYLILFENALYARETEYILSDYFFSLVAIGLAIEFTRRTTGWFMPILILISLSYILFLGRYIDGVFSFPGLSLETVLYRSFFTSEGMFGLTANISSTFVFMFIIFGSFLLRSGAGDFIVRLAQCLAGRFTGGAGLVAVVGSGLMGSVSGSAVANTVSTGVITIPMMKKSGFPSRFSAGVVAAASTGGALMPPVMGAGAFVLASYTQISYLTIIAASTLPAVLYFLTVSYFVRIEAKRLGLTPANSGDTEQVSTVLKEGWHFIIPISILVSFLVVGRTPTTSAAFAIISVIGASWLSSTPMLPKDIFNAVVDGVKTMVSTALLLIAVGIIINVVTTTGVGNAFSLMIVEWAQGSLLITLILVALASLVLGMGLPVTASYIVLATLSAPLIFDLITQSQLLAVLQEGDLPSNVAATIGLFGGDPLIALQEMPLEMKQIIRQEMLEPELLTGMLLSAHLIIFWLSQDSNVTPPVCLASFAAAGIAGTRPIATGLTSWKVAKGLYLVPVLFAYSPLISGSWPERIEVFFWSCMGLYAMAGLLQWHLETKLNPITAGGLLLSAILLMWTPFPLYYHVIGAVILISIIVAQGRQEKNITAAA